MGLRLIRPVLGDDAIAELFGNLKQLSELSSQWCFQVGREGRVGVVYKMGDGRRMIEGK